jgi:hypothetical protein
VDHRCRLRIRGRRHGITPFAAANRSTVDESNQTSCRNRKIRGQPKKETAMRVRRFAQGLAGLLLGIGLAIPAVAQQSGVSGESPETQAVPSRVVENVNDVGLVKLTGNTHPMARAEFDLGRVDSNKLLERVVMVLKRSPEQEAALAAFNQQQYDPKSPNFHHWLSAEEFGKLYGPSDADISAVTNWLENQGMQINEVGKGRVYIQFTGTVGNIESAFHVEMHNYLAEGKVHLANDRDP